MIILFLFLVMKQEFLEKRLKKHRVYLSIGVSERVLNTGTLYNTNLIFSPDGELLNVHRKLKPTGSERVVWGDANTYLLGNIYASCKSCFI